MPAELLSDIAIQRELGSLGGWARRGGAIVKTYQFKTFPEGIAFVGRVADLAESANHHPDIDIRYTKVTLSLSTHDSGGVTQNDLDLARAIESAHGAD
jgi:4a-hydroxytetrahydrobiopterin dehydratase